MAGKAIGGAAASGNVGWRGAASWFWLIGGLTLFVFGSVVAFTQKPHFDPLRPAPGWLSADFWRYPVERNAFRRMPVIDGNLNDVFVSSKGAHIWAVGEKGLIVHSGDGGIAWQRQWMGSDGDGAPPSQGAGLGVVSAAHAEMAPANPAQQTSRPAIAEAENAGAARQAPLFTGRSPDLNSVFFLDNSRGWIVGGNGTILGTVDGGRHWQLQASQTDASLNSVRFAADGRRGWAVGNNGVVLATDDGGRYWTIQTSRTDTSLNSIRFLADGRQGWAAGNSGTILHTDDGGLNWEPQSSRTRNWLSSVEFLADGRVGWAVGNGGTVLRTDDGGQTWEPQTSNTSDWLRSVQFLADGLHGWAVGFSGTILVTTDGGRRWNPLASNTSDWLRSVRFLADGRRGWAVGFNGTVLATVDSGQNWKLQTRHTGNGLDGVQVLSGGQRGWAVGSGGTILATGDGGQSWKMQASHTGLALGAVAFLADGRHGWAVGDGGTILATENGGDDWKPQASHTGNWLRGVQFLADGRHGWAVGNGGTVLATADGGQNWKLQPSTTGNGLVGIQFLADGRRGWAVGESGTILATADGGETWNRQIGDTTEHLVGVRFLADGLRGWAVGHGGTILATTDGGGDWNLQRQDTESANFSSVHFLADGRRGWVAGSKGTILAIGNGGSSWLPQRSHATADLSGIQFLDDGLHGWAIGDRDTILSTQDGGDTWADGVLPYRRHPAPWFHLLWPLSLLAMVHGILAAAKASHREPPSAANRSVTDKPAQAGSIDYLGSRRIAADLARFLSNRKTEPPLTLAITGDWGMGKSSVMNYLFADLKRNGLKPVWFNAWHHREEQHVLASILENVRRQAVPYALSPGGLWFRFRLLLKRHVLYQAAFILAVAALTYLFALQSSNPEQWQAARHYLSYVVGLENPTLLTQRSVSRLCPTGAMRKGETKPAAPDKAASGTSGGKPFGNEGNPEHSVPFNSAECAGLHALVWTAAAEDEGAKAGAAGFGGAGACKEESHCFDSEADFVNRVRRSLHLAQLTTEQQTALLTHAEHLAPQAIFIRDEIKKIGASLAAFVSLLLLILIKGGAVLGFTSAELARQVLRGSGLVEAKEPVGFRQLYERRFRHITELFGRRRLVLFIDDLDRCERDYAMRVLEMTNFLAGAGDLFIVLGMAPRYVLANVNLHFRDMAQAVHEADMEDGVSESGRPAAHGTPAHGTRFARNYLQKLVHIEVPVPRADENRVLALLSERNGERDYAGEVDRFLGRLRRVAAKTLKVAVMAAVVAYAGVHGAGSTLGVWLPQFAARLKTEWNRAEPKPAESMADVPPSAPVAGSSAPVQGPVKPSEFRDTEEAGAPSFRPGDPDDPSPWAMALPGGLLAALSLLGGMAFYLNKPPASIDRWLGGLWNRLRVRLFGPVRTEDSEAFGKALDIWHQLIALADPTPRNIKAFLNRVRYFVSRAGAAGDHREAHIVALATIHYAFGEQFDWAVSAMERCAQTMAYGPEPWLPEATDKLRILYGEALVAHRMEFGGFPGPEDREFFARFTDDIEIHRRM